MPVLQTGSLHSLIHMCTGCRAGPQGGRHQMGGGSLARAGPDLHLSCLPTQPVTPPQAATAAEAELASLQEQGEAAAADVSTTPVPLSTCLCHAHGHPPPAPCAARAHGSRQRRRGPLALPRPASLGPLTKALPTPASLTASCAALVLPCRAARTRRRWWAC